MYLNDFHSYKMCMYFISITKYLIYLIYKLYLYIFFRESSSALLQHELSSSSHDSMVFNYYF